MRAVFPLIVLSLAAGAAAEPSPPTSEPEIVMPSPDTRPDLSDGRTPCRDTVHMVRQERGLPQLRRETAAPDEPLLIAAVDHRIDGCSVMVMRNNTSDVRPLPALPENSGRLQRIPGG